MRHSQNSKNRLFHTKTKTTQGDGGSFYIVGGVFEDWGGWLVYGVLARLPRGVGSLLLEVLEFAAVVDVGEKSPDEQEGETDEDNADDDPEDDPEHLGRTRADWGRETDTMEEKLVSVRERYRK